MLNPVREIVEAVRQKHDPLMFVDGVTAIYGSDLRIKELDLDALVFGTQKALALPPGLAVICCSDRLLEKAKTVPGRGYYFDLLQMKKMADKNYSLTTPPVSLMYALDFQLERILKEGMAARYRRHQEMAEEVHKWAMAHHGLFAEPGYMSHTITVLNRGDIDFSKLNKGLKERSCEISGYGNIKERRSDRATWGPDRSGDTRATEENGRGPGGDEMIKLLVTDELSKEGLEMLKSGGQVQVDIRPGIAHDELIKIIGDYDALIIRSGTKVDAAVIEAGKNLKVVGRAGVGVDNVDVKAATRKGILVMNTPAANIISAAEHTMALMMSLARNIVWADASLKKGEWKRSKFTGFELNGKTLGIVGIGRVGGEVAKRAKSFQMKLIGFDLYPARGTSSSV